MVQRSRFPTFQNILNDSRKYERAFRDFIQLYIGLLHSCWFEVDERSTIFFKLLLMREKRHRKTLNVEMCWFHVVALYLRIDARQLV